jgi:hypothetical protein
MNLHVDPYEVLLWIVIGIKVIWSIVDLFYILARLVGRNQKRVKQLEILNEQTLNLAELLMNIVLILIFYPRRKSSDIKINKHEQIIIFFVGLLGVIHTKWEQIAGLFGIKLPKEVVDDEKDLVNS